MEAGKKLLVLAAVCWVAKGTPSIPSSSNHLEESPGLFITKSEVLENVHTRARRSFWGDWLEVIRDIPDSDKSYADPFPIRKRREIGLCGSITHLLNMLANLFGLSTRQSPHPASVPHEGPHPVPYQTSHPVRYQAYHPAEGPYQAPHSAGAFHQPSRQVQVGFKGLEDVPENEVKEYLASLLKSYQPNSLN